MAFLLISINSEFSGGDAHTRNILYYHVVKTMLASDQCTEEGPGKGQSDSRDDHRRLIIASCLVCVLREKLEVAQLGYFFFLDPINK